MYNLGESTLNLLLGEGCSSSVQIKDKNDDNKVGEEVYERLYPRDKNSMITNQSRQYYRHERYD